MGITVAAVAGEKYCHYRRIFIGRELDDCHKYYDEHMDVQIPLLLVSNRFLGKIVRSWQGLKSCAVAHTTSM